MSAHATLLAADKMVEAYQKIFASTRTENVCCWYLGTLFMHPVDGPEIPLLHVAAVMAYRIDAQTPASFRMRWTEVGQFRDPVTGGAATSWLNPLTGATVPTPRTFRDGPGEYLVNSTQDGLAVSLEQTGALVDGVSVSIAQEGPRVFLQQVERKRRRLQTGPAADPDAPLPKAVTTLSLWADRSEVEDDARASVHASGSYSFEGEGLPGLPGLESFQGTTVVRGIMRKAATDEVLHPAAWEALQETYPDFFDADRVAPRWDE